MTVDIILDRLHELEPFYLEILVAEYLIGEVTWEIEKETGELVPFVECDGELCDIPEFLSWPYELDISSKPGWRWTLVDSAKSSTARLFCFGIGDDSSCVYLSTGSALFSETELYTDAVLLAKCRAIAGLCLDEFPGMLSDKTLEIVLWSLSK